MDYFINQDGIMQKNGEIRGNKVRIPYLLSKREKGKNNFRN
jgi:hypothetical protein